MRSLSLQDFWEDVALKTWINLNPSTQWANRQIEPYRGLPFGHYLHTTRPRRPRALTLPLQASDESWWPKVPLLSETETLQVSNEQLECNLLWKLPLDVRIVIYEHVLGGNDFHLTAQSPKDRIQHYICRCPSSISDHSQHMCSEPVMKRADSVISHTLKPGSDFLPLLLTCRQIYSEAIEILYRANTFEFTQNFTAFTFLRFMLPPQRLHSLRHFRLHMRIPRHPTLNSRASRDWQDLWRFLAHEMSGLQSLYLEMQMLQPMEAIIETTRDDEAASWLEPVVNMAVDAYRDRRCDVELETRSVKHAPAELFQRLAAGNDQSSRQELVLATCAALHERIRVSLGGDG